MEVLIKCETCTLVLAISEVGIPLHKPYIPETLGDCGMSHQGARQQ